MFFGRPEMLWLLAVVAPLLSLFYWRAWKVRQRLIRRFVQSRLLAVLTVGVSPLRQKARMVLVVLAVTLAMLALARPLWGYTREEYTRRGVDILVAIDTSRSMLAQDVQPNRLTRAKLAALDLMKLAQGDRLGLIAFAGTAFLQCPLTIDWAAFEESVNALDTEVILQQGTALAQAIEAALDAFKTEGNNFKALVIFSDGEDHEAGVLAAARRAAAAGVRIYTVGVGTPEGDRLRFRNANGETQYLTDKQGRPVVSKLNDGILRQIAQITNGEYLPLKGADPMKQLYENRIALLPQSEYGARLGRRYFDRYQWPLGLALLLLVIEMLLPCRRRVTEEAVRSVHRGAVGKLAGLWVCLLLGAGGGKSLQASVRQAMRAYELGDYATARQEFQREIDEGRDDPRLHFNAGVSAYRLHQYEEAANELSAAILSSEPELLQPAYYNLGNALFRMGEKVTDPTQKKQRWESALKAYEAALKLNPDDQDAAFNRDVVRAKLELLKQQQQQQQKQDQQKQQQQKKQDQKKQNPSQQSDQSQSQKQQQKQQKQQSQQSRKKQEQPKKQSGEQKKQQPKQQQAPRPQPKQSSGKTNETHSAQAKPVPKNQMTPEQARRLLEAVRNNEHLWFEAERNRQPHSTPSGKPW